MEPKKHLKRKHESKPSTSGEVKKPKIIEVCFPAEAPESGSVSESESKGYCEKTAFEEGKFVNWLQESHENLQPIPKLNWEFPVKTFKFNSEDFSIEKIENCGRGVKTRKKIKFNTTVLRQKPFAAVVEPSENEYFCSFCHRIDTSSYVTCKKCKSVPYCSKKCYKDDDTHCYLCGMNFDAIDDLDVKLIIKMVLQTMFLCGSGEKMKEEIENYVKKEKLDESLPLKKYRDKMDKPMREVDCIMRLCRKKCDDNMCKKAETAYYMKTFKKIKKFFKNGGDSYLPYLLKHFLGIIEANAFNSTLKTQTKDLKRNIIYTFGSFFNHSCIPSLMSRTIGNELVLTALRNIEKGEELSISYIFFYKDSKEERQEKLKLWNFTCSCKRCTTDDISKEQFKKAFKKTFEELRESIAAREGTEN